MKYLPNDLSLFQSAQGTAKLNVLESMNSHVLGMICLYILCTPHHTTMNNIPFIDR